MVPTTAGVTTTFSKERIGVPGTAQRLFGALREGGISVILISQGSSEHSICFAILQGEAERTARIVEDAFQAELRGGQIQAVDVVRQCSILSVVWCNGVDHL